MKKLISKPAVFAVAAFAGYIICMIITVAAVSFYPLKQQNTFLQNIIDDMGGKYLNGETNFSTYSDHVQIFDISGARIMDFDPNEAWSSDVSESAVSRSVSQALSGRSFFYFEYNNDNDLNDLVVLKSGPILDGADIAGAVVVIRNMKNIPESIEGAAIIVSVLYWIIIILLVISHKRKLRYAELEKNYVANVTHALKAPIASVRALTEALIDVVPAESDKQQPYFGKILKETTFQNHIVQEILDLSKIQSDRVDFTKSEVTLDECFSEPIEKFRTYCELADIPFTVTENFRSIEHLHSNAHCLSEIMNILLENAVKYVENGEIIIDAAVDKKCVVISVRNTKGVIAREDLPKIFDRFFIGRNGEGKNGSGLGLSIVAALIKGLKEKIKASSNEKDGTTFSFTVRM